MFKNGSRVATVAAGVLAAMAVSAAPASAQSAKPVAGKLNCKSKGSVGLILGSNEALSCSYNPAGKAPPQPYSGTLTKYGLDLGVSGETIMIWTILGSSSELPDGALAGNYAGVSAEAAVGLGA